MAELLALLRLLAPGLLVCVLDRSRGRAVGRSSVIAGLGAGAPACADLLRRALGGMVCGARPGLLTRAWAAEAIAAALAVLLPVLVRLVWEVRAKAAVAALAEERARLVSEWVARA